MAQAATAAKPTAVEKQRRKLAEELVGIHKKHRPDLERADGLKAQLKQLATDSGQNFRELFAGVGLVKVNGAKAKEFKGKVPTVDVDAWNALTDKQRESMLEKGTVKMVDEYTGAYYGGVTVDLF